MFKEEEMTIVTSWNIDQTIDLRVGERRKKMTVDQMYAKILSSGNGMIVNRLFKIIKGKPVLDSLSRSEPKKNNNNNLHYRSPFQVK